MYDYDTVLMANFALSLCKGDQKSAIMMREYISEHKAETQLIDVCKILFCYYMAQYKIATTDKERDSVVNDFVSTYNSIFAGNYIPCDVIRAVFEFKCANGDTEKSKSLIIKIFSFDIDENFFITYRYIYRKLANYIVNTGIFCVEPFTTILNTAIQAIENVNFDLSVQPNYLD